MNIRFLHLINCVMVNAAKRKAIIRLCIHQRRVTVNVTLPKPAKSLPPPQPHNSTIIQSEILRFPGAFPGVEILNLSHNRKAGKITPFSG